MLFKTQPRCNARRGKWHLRAGRRHVRAISRRFGWRNIAIAPSLLGQLIGQFDSVGVLPVALVLFRQDFFEPPCLLLGNLLIRGLRIVADDELLAAAVAPERSHLLEPNRFLSAALFNCYRPHVAILVGNSLDSYIGPSSAFSGTAHPNYVIKWRKLANVKARR
jgi:hypothetical protein